MKAQTGYIITFHSTYWALAAERVLQTAGFSCRLRPVPREFSSSCGVCVAVETDDLQSVLQVLQENAVEHEEYYGPR
ncbi:MAG: DUF3343 domain-containing protein [Bacillota bacterium]|jgi:hypothetical protein